MSIVIESIVIKSKTFYIIPKFSTSQPRSLITTQVLLYHNFFASCQESQRLSCTGFFLVIEISRECKKLMKITRLWWKVYNVCFGCIIRYILRLMVTLQLFQNMLKHRFVSITKLLTKLGSVRVRLV